VNRDRLDYWRGRGAQPSHTLERLLKRKPSEAAASPPKGRSQEKSS
jgi:ribosomal protein S16